jgi:hypothetical protein
MRESILSKRFKLGRRILVATSIVSAIYSVVVASTPLLGEEGYVGTSYVALQASNPKVANIIWHDTVGFGILLLGVSLLGIVLSWKGLITAPSLAWNSLLLLGLALLAALLLAHVPIGNTSLTHVGPGIVLLSIYFVGIVLSATRAFLRWPKSEA